MLFISEKGEEMSKLFEESTIKGMELRNRFVRSATDEAMAGPKGEITDPLIKLYSNLAKGGIGLIISGHFYVHPSGQATSKQKGIYSDELIPGLRRLVDAVHENGAKIGVGLGHCEGGLIGLVGILIGCGTGHYLNIGPFGFDAFDKRFDPQIMIVLSGVLKGRHFTLAA